MRLKVSSSDIVYTSFVGQEHNLYILLLYKRTLFIQSSDSGQFGQTGAVSEPEMPILRAHFPRFARSGILGSSASHSHRSV